MIRILLFLFTIVSVAFAGTSPAGIKYLEAKKLEDGVIETSTGLLYKKIRTVPKGKSPTINSPCSCHYSGRLIDGTEFDSSYKRGQPLTFAPNQVIKGWYVHLIREV